MKRKSVLNSLTSLIWMILSLSSFFTYAQSALSKADYSKTLLQVSSGFYTVEKNATVDLDSSLFITSKWHKLSRVPVITEGIDGNYTAENCRWMDKNNSDSVRKKLPLLTGANHARLSLLIGAYYAFHPAFQTKYIDSGIFYLTQAKKECDQLHLTNWSLQCACLLGKCYFKRNDISTGTKWFKTITDNTGQNPDTKIIAKAWNYAGMYCPFLANTTTFRLDCLHKALTGFESLKDTSNQINTLMNIAYMSVANQDLKSSENAALRSLFLQKASHFKYNQFTIDLLAYLAEIKSDYPKELELAFNAVKNIAANKDSLALGHFYGRIASSYDYLQDPSESILWKRKSLAAFEQHSGDSEIYSCLRDIALSTKNVSESRRIIKLTENALRESPPNNATDKQFVYMTLAHCYENMNELEKAKKYYVDAENIEKKTPLLNGGMANFRLAHSLGNFYLKTKNYKLSKTYFSKLLTDPYKRITPKEIIMNVYFKLHIIDSVMGSYQSSLTYFNKYSLLNDTIFSKNQSKQIAILDITYKTQQREKDLQLLRAQNQLNLQRENTTRKFSIAGFIALLFVIIMIYNRYYYNKKSNDKLQAQKEEIDQQNHELQVMNQNQKMLLTEKEWLLREIHHRVKNNLQTTMSLLKMQSAYINNESALEAMRNSQRRMYAMSLIHQKLYQSDEMTHINIKDYIYELVYYLKDSYSSKIKGSYSDRNKITYELNVATVDLDIVQAIPLGLIINEAVTNAIKYAFPNEMNGVITILLKQTHDDHFLLNISDNGVGLPADFDLNSTNSLGMNLMRGLCDQLQGEFSLERYFGTGLKFTFKRVDKIIREDQLSYNKTEIS